jgi:hypothetical protein
MLNPGENLNLNFRENLVHVLLHCANVEHKLLAVQNYFSWLTKYLQILLRNLYDIAAVCAVGKFLSKIN